MRATIWDEAPDGDPGAAALVLLRNHGTLLPLTARSLRTVAVLGPPALAELVDAALPRGTVIEDPRAADMAVVVAGDDALVRAVNDAQPRTVAVVTAEEPVPLPWLDRVPAVLLGDIGPALVGALFGAVEPYGRLRRAWSDALPLGHGLGYTTWEYLALEGSTVTLVNAGTRAGREVVQVYSGGALAGFAVVEARPGETVSVEIELARHDDLVAGHSSADLRVTPGGIIARSPATH